ncbi:hypothetical protein GIB67_020332 [Kingdonia uniflora]|uniref:Lipoxygenase n=1 Tax=Kingdonia uniflora TaxID=39325 RepID=A0A7J7NJ22_9MAGN|nr:hypothetical protein GIB67_020332 [Kingdonia uniflora]
MSIANTLLKPTLLKSEITASLIPNSLVSDIFGTQKNERTIFWTKNPRLSSRVTQVRSIREVRSSESKNIRTAVAPNISIPKETKVQVVITIRKKNKETLTEKIEGALQSLFNGFGKGMQIQLISEEIDPVSKSGKRLESSVGGWLSKQLEDANIAEYSTELMVPSDFGCPGAVLVTNLQPNEFYLMGIVVHASEGPLSFPANSWIQSRNVHPESRIIFRNQAYLPSQTPAGLKDLRREDLISVRGKEKGKRDHSERIYNYATYNDLGNPDKDDDLARPVLGGEKWPYPRRCRTGRAATNTDAYSESRVENPDPVYVPRDETFEESKQASFSSSRLKAKFHNLLPALTATVSGEKSFKCFTEIDKLYSDGILVKHDKNEAKIFEKLLLPVLINKIVKAGLGVLKYDIPAIISRDRFSWLRDNEFARQALAGVNPVNIERLKEFPILSKLDPAIYGPPESLITKELIEQELEITSVEQAIENNQLFIIDYHDILLPFVKKINDLPETKTYASRTVFYYTKSGVLKPIAIELSLPPTPSAPQNKRVYTHGHDSTSYWVWKLAKAHVCANDAGIHQLVNHWLRTHACTEPYIISTHRQLSSIHPIYKLLHPHMRYTLEINSIARQSLINAGGIIEECFMAGKYSMELSSAAYDSMWRFDMEGLPADLIRRGMAVEDPSMPCGVRLIIEDYPYAADGLLIWSAIKEWVEAFVAHFYSEPNSITSDIELKAWWDEIKNKGHHDKQSEPWWPKLQTKEDLSGILTTMIWVTSGQHAALNFGQYPFGGYVPNRPTQMRKLIPHEDDREYEEFMSDPQSTFLSSLPAQLQATKIMAAQDTLSTHSPDEEYLGKLHQFHWNWINDYQIRELLEKFSSRLVEIECIINVRNKNTRLKNRNGAGIPPYELLIPSSGPGVTGRGIPNSISI